MRKIISIIVLVLGSFLVEFFMYNLAGRFFLPNLSLLLIIFLTLYLGIRYSICTAVFAGLLKDSFGTVLFGTNIFSFIICAYITVVLKKYFHYHGYGLSLLLLILVISVLNIIIHFILYLMIGMIDPLRVLNFIVIPEVLSTLVITPLIYYQFKKYAVRFL